MKKSGLADSPFFKKAEPAASLPVVSKEKKKTRKTVKPRPNKDTVTSSNHDTKQPRNHDIVVSWDHAEIIEAVRKAVKELGKEAATHRFTIEEKKAITDIIYSYKRQGTRTSENEITRIAVNFIINDYQENGENSILEKTLRALNE